MSGFALAGSDLARHENRWLALTAAAAAHVGLLAMLVLFPARPPMLPIGSSVPINIVSSAPATDSRMAVQAPETVAAAAPQPEPQAPPQPPAPEVATPSFTRLPPTPAKPAKPTPQQPSLNPTHPTTSSVDWSRMQQIIDSAKRSASAQASSAVRGPARVETAAQARPDAGQGLSESDKLGLQQLLERLWNPNCDAPGGSAVKLPVKFIVSPTTGRLLAPPNAGGLENSPNPVMAAAARRAIDAVREAEPYGQPYYGWTITVNFDAKEACSKR
jgi:protein TonB